MEVGIFPAPNTVAVMKTFIGVPELQYKLGDEDVYPKLFCPAQGEKGSRIGYFHCRKLDTEVSGRFCTNKCCGENGFID